VYPVGRLDIDSEGLLLLTNDTKINHRLLNPAFKHTKTYWVQVEGQITYEAIKALEKGVKIKVDGKEYQTLPSKAFIFEQEPILPERNPPIRFRKNIPTSWLSLSIVEGKKHQVRKMTASVGFPTLRLVRYSIQNICLENMQVGDVKELDRDFVYKNLFSE
jgi:23S rRNA pseudouridine2457 synthase